MILKEIIREILQKNGLSPTLPVREFSAGQVNHVYQVGEHHVLKIEKDLDVTSHQPEIMRMVFTAGAKVPEVIDSGTLDGAGYLLTTYTPGKQLSEDWHLLSPSQREGLIEQIVAQLRILHSIRFEKYSSQRPRLSHNWEQALDAFTEFHKTDALVLDDKTRENLAAYREFYESHKAILQESGSPVLVHNDLHFDNILHQNGILTGIIDFDFSRQAPKDYELWRIVDFFNAPKYYVEKKLEGNWKSFQLCNEISLFKKFYPELFAQRDLVIRLKLYFSDLLLSSVYDKAFDKFNDKFTTYFATDWLERALDI